MKKALLLMLALAAAAGLVRGTPEYSYHRLRGALTAGDVATVEQHLDLGVISGLAVDMLAATTAEAAKETAGSIGSALVNAFAAALSPVLKGALAPLSADEVRKGIADKQYASKLGEFEFEGVFDGLRSIQRLDSSALVDLNGRCGGKSAKLRLVMEKHGGPVSSLIPNWKVTGVDKASLPEFVKACLPEAAKAAAAPAAPQ
jgi:hypothetical protein